MNKSKTNIELIIDIIRSGKTLSLAEITAMISEISGKKVKTTDISSQLSRLSNKGKTEIGYLIRRHKTDDGAYAYSLVNEALDILPEEMYDLTRKTGKNRFTLGNAVDKYPALKKYVKDAAMKPSKTVKVKEAATVVESVPQPQNNELDLVNLVRKLVGAGLKIDVNVNVRFSKMDE